jgi:putative endonuclease
MRAPRERRDQPMSRQEAERRGHLAEALAAFSLQLRGYRILARRHRTRLGEIDLIVKRGAIIAFVEVKARSDERAAIDAVSHMTATRIRSASDLWIAAQMKRGVDLSRVSYRYDIVAITLWRWPRHFADAF